MRKNPFQPISGFDAQKSAEICTFFCNRAGGRIDKLKLIKLAYLAERRFLSLWGFPMMWDEFYSLPHGPICSATLNGIDGVLDSADFSNILKRHGRQDVYLLKDRSTDFDTLSEAEIENLEVVWHEYGGMTASQLRNFTHAHCPEYSEVSQGRLPIDYRDVLKAVGYNDIDFAILQIEQFRGLEARRVAI
jgi:uncharacterized phage-associated protein